MLTEFLNIVTGRAYEMELMIGAFVVCFLIIGAFYLWVRDTEREAKTTVRGGQRDEDV